MNRKQELKIETVEEELRDKNATLSKLDYEIAVKQYRLAECEERISKIEQFRESLEKLTSYIESYLPLFPVIEELLKAFKELIVDGLYWFPRIMRWNASKGEVTLVFSDYHNEGYNYRIVAYRNLVTKELYSVESIQKKIKAENRIGTLELLGQEIAAVEILEKESLKDKTQN